MLGFTHRLKHTSRKRGMALLLVMIGMVVCTILTAGFLASQGTSIGIARNERDASKSRGVAQTGIDMCYWLIRNKSDWRTTMTPGTWLSNAAIGDGTVSVTASDAGGSNSFITDNTQAVILSSTGTYDGRTFVLTASVRPTGGGTVFYNGNFIPGTIIVGNGDLLTASTVDSYNSNVAAYNSLFPGSNAAFGSNSVVNNALTVYFPSVFRGSYLAAPTAILGTVESLLGGALGPASVSTATESRTPGTVIPPNTANLAYRGAFNWVGQSSSKTLSTPGRFDSITVTSNTVNINTSGIYYVTGNVSVGSTASSVINIMDGVSVVLMIDGNLSITAGQIKLSGATSQLAIYVGGNLAISSGTGALNANGSTTRVTCYGTGTGNITLTNNCQMVASVFAPNSAMTMQTGITKFYGGAIVHDLRLKDLAQFHFDEAVRNLKISNVTGGSASPGSADYRITLYGGPGVQR